MIEPAPPAVEAQSLNLWTTREVPFSARRPLPWVTSQPLFLDIFFPSSTASSCPPSELSLLLITGPTNLLPPNLPFAPTATGLDFIHSLRASVPGSCLLPAPVAYVVVFSRSTTKSLAILVSWALDSNSNQVPPLMSCVILGAFLLGLGFLIYRMGIITAPLPRVFLRSP